MRQDSTGAAGLARYVTAVGAAAVIGLGVTACGALTGTGSTDTASTDTALPDTASGSTTAAVTTLVPPGAAGAPEGSPGAGPVGTGGDGGGAGGGDTGAATGGTGCSTDGAAAIEAAADRIAPPLSYRPDVPWRFDGRTNYNTCNDLSYATLATEGGTGSSPWQLLLFHRGDFVGTGIKCNASFQSVTGASPRTVDVTYRYLKEGEASAAPSGIARVSFVWNGDRVVMNGTLPYEVTYGKC